MNIRKGCRVKVIILHLLIKRGEREGERNEKGPTDPVLEA